MEGKREASVAVMAVFMQGFLLQICSRCKRSVADFGRAAKLLSNATEVQRSGHNLYHRNEYE